MTNKNTCPNIILLEDDDDIRDFLSGLLESYGCKAFLAKSLEETDTILKQNTINLALLDIMLPGTDGREVALYIADKYPKVAIYFMTGLEDCLESKHLEVAKGVLTKPFTIEQLKNIIEKAAGLPKSKSKKKDCDKSQESLELLTSFATEYEALRRQNTKLHEVLEKVPQISDNPDLNKCIESISCEHNTSMEHLRKLLEAARLSLKDQ